MKTISLVAVIALAFSAGLFAQDRELQITFGALDRDRDGYVSITEAGAQLDLLKQWTNVDKNADGQLEITEFSAFEIAPAYVQDDNDDDVYIGAAPN